MKRKIIIGGIIAVLLFIAIFGLHYYVAEQSTPEQLKATVTKKYTKTRHRTRRINRRVYTNGEPYQVYYFELELEDGTTKDIEVNVQKYSRTRYGSKIDVTRRKGLFGIPVIRIEKLGKSTENSNVERDKKSK
ncbi:MAG: hypothetical protein HDS89_01080 [Bacteroidales bacterium]|nr:hypothetical protein [Bacteroidales bacterium]